MKNGKKISALRKSYWFRFAFRICVLVVGIYLYIFKPERFGVLDGFNFFTGFSEFHLLWLIWVLDMLPQLFSYKNKAPLGLKKQFERNFSSPQKSADKETLKKYITASNRKAAGVFALWCFCLALGGTLYFCGLLGKKEVFIVTLLFYVGDLVCVLIWCPFRVLMKSRCCTSCRIFNWDHFFMFSPIMFLGGFYSISLFALSLAVLAVWEINLALHPERFFEGTNKAIQCKECTDKLCTQFCPKTPKYKTNKETVKK